MQWSQCDSILTELSVLSGYNGTVNCANLTVPLGYTNNTSNATIELNFLHVPVSNGRSETGTVQLNYGGPGLAGRAELASSITIYQAYMEC
jgi:hypothetical protein